MSLRPATAEPTWVRTLLLAITLLFLGAFLVTPLVAVFAEAFRKGVGAYFESFHDPAVLSAIKLTLLAACAHQQNLTWQRRGSRRRAG